MKGFHFFAELPPEYAGKHKTKTYPGWTRGYIKTLVGGGVYIPCVAVFLDRARSRISRGEVMRDCIAATTDLINPPVCLTSCSEEWLNRRTTQIDEATARRAHPGLFKYLDRIEGE